MDRVARVLTRDIVTIGASAGGVAALLALCGSLPPKLAAAVLVVQHIGDNSSVLPGLLTLRGNNRAIHPHDGQPVEHGTVYVAPPDHHMLVENGVIRLTRSAKEHHTRPAIDPLFRSAAVAYGPRVIGVVLTGRLDDGTVGLRAIKDCGGVAVVQDPTEAEHPSMPESAVRNVAVDRCVPLADMARTVVELMAEPLPPGPAETPSRERVERELRAAIGRGRSIEHLNALGQPSAFACPDCAGVLWEINDTRPPRYRCHTGHAFSMRSLDATQAQSTEDAIWSATRALQMREELLRRLAQEQRMAGAEAEAARISASADEAARHAGVLLRMLNATRD